MSVPPLFDRESDPSSTLGGAALPPVTPQELREEEAFANVMVDRVLLHGPNTRFREFSLLMGVVRDFLRGFRALHFVGPCVTVFGSARFKEDHPYYKTARAMGSAIAKMGFTVMTGGGPGIMEAANRGAKDVGGLSIGCNIRLPLEQSHNRYLDRWVTMEHFFVRKTLLIKYSYGFVIMPGGFGTMDELFEALTLIQTGKIRNFPIVVMGTAFWPGMQQLLEDMLAGSTISPEDRSLILWTDKVDEAIAHLQENAVKQFGLQVAQGTPRRSSLLGEKGLAAPAREP